MLVLEEQNGRVPRQEIKGGEVTLGRRPDNTVCLDAEAFSMVSGLHAHILETAGGWVLEDDNSTNGTFLNGRRLTQGQRVTLKSGDRIQLANHGPSFSVYLPVSPSPSRDIVMTYRLRVLTGGKRGKIVILPHGTTIIGTGASADLRFDPIQDPDVALEHIALHTREQGLEARDLTGGKGLFINGRQVMDALLGHRDQIRVGLDGPEIELEVLSLPREQATMLEAPPPFDKSAPLKVSVASGARATGAPAQLASSPGKPRSFLQALVAEYEGAQARRTGQASNAGQSSSTGRITPDSDAPGPTAHDSGEAGVISTESGEMRLRFQENESEGSSRQSISGHREAVSPGQKPRPPWVQVVILLALLILTCVVSIILALTLRRRSEPALLDISSHSDIVSLADADGSQPLSREQQFARDLDSLLKQLGVQRRKVEPEARAEILHYLEQTRDAHPHRRVEHYLPEIIDILNSTDLPLPLMYLPWVESRFDPAALSPAGATGLWQFMGKTARRYGLEATVRADDERKDWVRETRIAALYLRDLMHFDYPEWDPLLAIAAYNRGEEGIVSDLAGLAQRRPDLVSLENGDESLFWALRQEGLLPAETAEYVPRYLGAAVYFVFLEHYI